MFRLDSDMNGNALSFSTRTGTKPSIGGFVRSHAEARRKQREKNADLEPPLSPRLRVTERFYVAGYHLPGNCTTPEPSGMARLPAEQRRRGQWEGSQRRPSVGRTEPPRFGLPEHRSRET